MLVIVALSICGDGMKSVKEVSYILLVLLFVPWQQAQAEDMYDKAKQAIQVGHIDQAEELLNKQVKVAPDDYRAWFLLGVVEAQGKHFHPAIEAFRRVIELRDDLAEPHNNLAVIYNELGDVKAAVKELEMSLKKQPGYAVAEENIADLYVKLALMYYKKALVKNNSSHLQQRYARLLQVRDTQHDGTAEVEVNRHAKQETSVIKPVVVAKAKDVEVVVPQKVDGTQQKVASVYKPMTDAHEAIAVEKSDAKVIDEKAVEVAESKTVEPAQQNTTESVVDKRMPVAVDQDLDVAAVQEAIEAWRKAWQGQDLATYFSAYASDYTPPSKHSSLKAWKSYKQRVIGNKSYIKVEIHHMKIDISSDKHMADVHFKQRFRSNSYQADDMKLIRLEKRKEGWKINYEGVIAE